MKNNRKTSVILGFLTVLAILVGYTSCKKITVNGDSSGKTPVMPSISYQYLTVHTPNGDMDLRDMLIIKNRKGVNGGIFGNPGINPGSNSVPTDISDEKVALGRVLFYDRRMSINNTVACGTCHVQSKAFSDGLAFSSGFGDKKTLRNSMAIINPVEMNNLFWDSRASSPFDLSLRPVFNHIEMGIETDEMLVKKIKGASFYNDLFTKAYGNNEVTRDKIAECVSYFLNAIYAGNSKFDAGNQTNFSNLTTLEKMGKDMFFSDKLNCRACHAGNNFSAPDNVNMDGSGYGSPEVKGTANIGLNLNYTDQGKGKGKFRIPSLRNVELTAPYMHDGRFATLEDVVEHYNSGIQNHPDLDDNLKDNGLPKRLNLTEIEKMALVAFLKTLTDNSFTKDVRYSDPFKN